MLSLTFAVSYAALTLMLLVTVKLNVIIQSVVAPLKAHQILVVSDPSMNEL